MLTVKVFVVKPNFVHLSDVITIYTIICDINNKHRRFPNIIESPLFIGSCIRRHRFWELNAVTKHLYFTSNSGPHKFFSLSPFNPLNGCRISGLATVQKTKDIILYYTRYKTVRARWWRWSLSAKPPKESESYAQNASHGLLAK